MSLGGIYLSYPIDQRGPASLGHMFEQVDKFKRDVLANEIAAWVFDPGDAFTVARRAKIDGHLAEINDRAAMRADVVVAFLPAGVATIGVPIEIDRAVRNCQHVIVFSDTESWMLQYPDSVVARFKGWEDASVNDALAWLAKQSRPDRPAVEIQALKFAVEDESFLPRRTYKDDAGIDLVVSQQVTVDPGTFMDIPCGVAVELPDWTWGLVTGRSSALRKRGLLVHPGVIDAGYRGPLYAGAWNMTEQPVTLRVGERVAQFIIIANVTRHFDPAVALELGMSARGNRGFGSTGE